jgi:hypothetical protein
MNIWLDSDAEVGREDNFKPAVTNEILHDISNDKGIRVVNFPLQKFLSRLQRSHM